MPCGNDAAVVLVVEGGAAEVNQLDVARRGDALEVLAALLRRGHVAKVTSA